MLESRPSPYNSLKLGNKYNYIDYIEQYEKHRHNYASKSIQYMYIASFYDSVPKF